MKKQIIYFILILFIHFSCSLDEVIYDKYVPQTVFTNSDGLRASVIATYDHLNSFNYNKSQGYQYPVLGHDLVAVMGGGVYLNHNKSTLLNSSLSTIKYPWMELYKIINQANITLHYGSDIEMNEEKKEEYLAHAYFLRAFAYFDLMRRHGGVPLKLDVTIDDTNLHVPRSSTVDVLDQIILDLKMAKEGLPPFSEQASTDFGLATQGAAKAFLAYAYLYKKEYQKVIETCDDIINSGEYSLIHNWVDIWDIDKERQAYQEVIFGIQYIIDPMASGGNSNGNEITAWMTPRDMDGAKGTARFGAQRWFYSMATNGVYSGDYRGENMFITKYYSTKGRYISLWPIATKGSSIPYFNKQRDYHQLTDSRNGGCDFFFIRFAEIYMLKAEAINELNGPTQDAINAFNKIRERARMADGTERTSPADLTLAEVPTKDDFRLALVQEKAVEFVTEGIRGFDLRRIKRDDGRTMYEYMLTEWIPDHYDLTKWPYSQYSDRLEYYERDLLMPIPSTELDLNTAISNDDQNSGW